MQRHACVMHVLQASDVRVCDDVMRDVWLESDRDFLAFLMIFSVPPIASSSEFRATGDSVHQTLSLFHVSSSTNWIKFCNKGPPFLAYFRNIIYGIAFLVQTGAFMEKLEKVVL